MRVIGYTYLADYHCPTCTGTDADVGYLKVNNDHPHAIPKGAPGMFDTNGLHFNLCDREGNLIHPVFDTDEKTEPQHCGDCCAEIL